MTIAIIIAIIIMMFDPSTCSVCKSLNYKAWVCLMILSHWGAELAHLILLAQAHDKRI